MPEYPDLSRHWTKPSAYTGSNGHSSFGHQYNGGTKACMAILRVVKSGSSPVANWGALLPIEKVLRVNATSVALALACSQFEATTGV